MLRSLPEKVDPRHCALLLVDVQNDFCAEGGAMHREGHDVALVQRMLPRLEKLLEQARAAAVKVIWIRNIYNSAANHYLSEVWLEQAQRRRNGAYVSFPVCEAGEWNGDFYRVRPLPDEVIVSKHRFGAFEGTDLDLILRSNGIRTVIVTGVATNVCCETTARQAFLKDYYVVFSSDCNATFTQAAHDATLANIDLFFGQVATADEIAACWPAQLRAAS
ncbi:MAG: cysteine hydrolase [Hyphomicrobiales bacterium]|nr:cysteine hydrolase [Hyphomicrobiales bacterium]